MKKIALSTPGGDINPIEGINPTIQGIDLLQNVISWSITMLMIGASLLCVALLVYGGIRWITSGGDKAGIEGARNTIVYALIGIIIIFLSYSILRLIGSIFGINLIRISP